MPSILILAVAALALVGCPQPTDPANYNVSFLVVESVNGTVVANAKIDILDPMTEEVVSTVYSNASGKVRAYVTPESWYTVVSSKTGHAQNRLLNFYVEADGSSTATLINQRLGMATRPAIAPNFHGFMVANTADLSDIAEYVGAPLDTSATSYIILTVGGPNAVEPTAWSGFGVKMDFDKMPTSFSGIDGVMLGDPCWDETEQAYLSDFLFDLSGLAFPDSMHELYVVAYDVANNRCEFKAPVEFTNINVGTDISTATFTGPTVDIRSYPVSRGFFSKDPGDSIKALQPYLGQDISYRVTVSFSLKDATPADVPILGFHVYRSKDGTTFTRVGGTNYGTLSTGASGTHTYFDDDSLLEKGTTYSYKVVAYTDAANTIESGVASSYLSAPFSALLSAPLNRSQMSVAAPHDYAFTISDTSLWNAAVSDFFYFSLSITEKAGPYTYIGQFRYNFTDGLFEAKYSNGAWFTLEDFGSNPTDIIYAAGKVTIKSTVLDNPYIGWALGGPIQYVSNTAYEWDITGDVAVLGGAGHPCWFEKATTGGFTRTYGNGYNEGGDAINGRFEFVTTE